MDERTSLQTPHPTAMLPWPLLQRKCACGNHSAAGECEACGKKHRTLLRKPAESYAPAPVPSVVDEVLRSPGQPLDAASRAFFEPRFSYDFSRVRIHTDARAAESASAVNALVYTVGRDLVFGAAQYEPQTSAGKRLIAHELTHTLQQEGNPLTTPARVSDPNGIPELEADKLADQVMSGQAVRPSVSVPAIQRTLFRIPVLAVQPPSTGSGPAATGTTRSTPPPGPVPPRGTNPADCAEAVCRLATSAAPTSDADAKRRVDDWERATIACVRADGPASNASHQAEIVSNEVGEISADAAELRAALGSLDSSRGRYLDFLKMISETCTRKALEVRIEFNYNVVFENPPGATRWGYGGGDWDSFDKALSALPPEATWTNRLLIRFSRAACHPSDLSSTGACVGTAGPSGTASFVGGEADPSTGRITVFNAGWGSTPFSRSRSLGLPATEQTLRHEVGHIAMSQISPDDEKRFFDAILPWTDYSWAWITTPASPYPAWRAERNLLRTELGFSEAQLDTWLAGLQPNVPVKAGDRTYTRTATGPGGSTLFLSSIDPTQLPAGVEFEYARTNRGEYLAELYALAVSRPEFLHNALPQRQIEWLKRVVFRIPATPEEWARRLAVGGNVPPGHFARLQRVFTWEQAQPILDEIIRQSSAGSRGAANA